MPKNLLRLLVALLVALTVPIQGIAAVSAGFCMALGHHGTGATAVHDHGSAAHTHESASAADPHHDKAPGNSSSSDSTAHCPPCVSCCAAAAIGLSSPLFVPEPAPGSIIAVAPVISSGVLPEQLDRPPLAL
jgi:hypothetical protein